MDKNTLFNPNRKIYSHIFLTSSLYGYSVSPRTGNASMKQFTRFTRFTPSKFTQFTPLVRRRDRKKSYQQLLTKN